MDNKRYTEIQSLWLFPIFILIIVMPLIFVVDSTPQIVSDNSLINAPYDLFTSGKSKLITFLGPLCLICTFFCKYFNQKNIRQLMSEPIFYAVSAYFLLVILSSVFSRFKDISFYGMTGRNEGMFVILCYFCFWLIVFIQIRNNFQLKALIGCFYFYIFISFIIGVSQFLDNDILTWSILESLVVPSELSDKISEVNKDKVPHFVYLTLLNSNYVGSMMALATAVGLSIYISASTIRDKVIHGIFASFSFFMLASSNSRGGQVATLIGIIFIAVAFYKKIIHNWRSTSVILAIFILIFSSINIYLDNVLIDRFKTIFNFTKSLTVLASETNTVNNDGTIITDFEIDPIESNEVNPETASESSSSAKKVTQVIYDFDFEANEIKVVLSAGTIFIRTEGEDLKVFSESNEPLNYEKIDNSNVYYITDMKYDGMYILWDSKQLTLMCVNRLTFEYESNKFRLITYGGQKIDTVKAPVFSLLKGRESLMSNRGYIWGRSIPMIKDTVLLGHGPDAFVMHFPQYEYSVKNEYFGTPSIVIDKPHSMFIQTAINTGLISLIALLAAYALYFIKLFKLIIRKGIEDKWVMCSACAGAGMTAYLVSGIVNDSVIFVAPIFWVIFGIGCAANINASSDHIISSES